MAIFSFLLIFASTAFSQTGDLSGIITDNNNQPLVTATVRVKGTQKATITNEKGRFFLKDVADNAILEVSIIGYVKREIKVSKGQEFTIVLQDDNQELSEVIVTGTTDARSRMQASIAISKVSSKDISRLAPTSSADLLKNIPGVYVNQGRGEIRSVITSRGLPPTISLNPGYGYVSLQEDGLPIIGVNVYPDYFNRADAYTGRVEAVRGGSSAIFAPNAPGGIFNFISKTGGKSFSGEVRTKFGLEGDGRNPYYRADFNFGGPLNKSGDLTYNIGGFYRVSDGARYAGYAQNNGGQIRANIVKTYKTGSVKVFAKFLDDRNGVAEFVPTVGWENPQVAPGFSVYDSYSIPAIDIQAPIFANKSVPFNTKDKNHNTYTSLGIQWTQELGRGFTLKNNGRFSNYGLRETSTELVVPYLADDKLFYAVTNLLGKFGTYTFKDHNSGQEYGTITQLPNIVNGALAGFKFIPGPNNNFPGTNVRPNTTLFMPVYYTSQQGTEFVNQLSLSKRLKDMSFTFGGYIDVIRQENEGQNNDFGNAAATLENRPHIMDITLKGLDGKTYQVTDPNGFLDVPRFGATTSKLNQELSSLMFNHEWQISSKLNLDYGVRMDNVHVHGFNQESIPDPLAAKPGYGGIDGNPLTLYDNRGNALPGPELPIDQSLTAFSWSGGLNYQIDNKQAVYFRYANASRLPELSDYYRQKTTFNISSFPFIARKVEQYEVAYKLNSKKIRLNITPFYSHLKNVPIVAIFTNADNTNYSPPTLLNENETYGVEIEATYNLTKDFAIKVGGLLQDSKAIASDFWIANNPGPQDDVIKNYNGNKVANVPNVMYNINPIYSKNRFFASLNYSVMGDRWGNGTNTVKLKGYSTLDLGLGYDLNKHVSLQANINNLTDNSGILDWYGTGGFPTALNTNLDAAFVQANPNAVYSTLRNMPRAYFISATFKF